MSKENATPETDPKTAAPKAEAPPRNYTADDYNRYFEAGEKILKEKPEVTRPLQDLSFTFVRGRAARTVTDYRELCLLAGILEEHFAGEGK